MASLEYQEVLLLEALEAFLVSEVLVASLAVEARVAFLVGLEVVLLEVQVAFLVLVASSVVWVAFLEDLVAFLVALAAFLVLVGQGAFLASSWVVLA